MKKLWIFGVAIMTETPEFFGVTVAIPYRDFFPTKSVIFLKEEWINN